MSIVGVPPTILLNDHKGGLSLSATDVKTMRELDASVDIIRNYIPADPYILTVPSTDPYQHRSRQDAEAWRRGTFFDSDEDEEVQYSTFLYREQGDSLFVCRSTVDIERDRREKERKLNGFRSGANTPSSSTGPKKKISLSAYKSKHAQAAGSKKSETIGSPGSKAVSASKGKQVHNGSPNSAQDESQAGQKRSFDTSNSQQIPNTDNHLVEKQKPSAKNSNLLPKSGLQEPQLQSNGGNSYKLPSKLSPEQDLKEQGLPPLLSPENVPNRHGLPFQLSPTLPPNVEDEIRKIKTSPHDIELASTKNQNSAAGKRLPSSLDNRNSVIDNEPAEINGENDNVKSKLLPDTLSNKETKHEANTNTDQSKAQIASRIVKFRFSKKLRREFERLVKLPSKGLSATHEDKERRDRTRDREGPYRALVNGERPKTNSEKPLAHSNESKSPGKRKRDVQELDLGVQTPKRQKAPNSAKFSPSPHTPAHHTSQFSPNLSSNSTTIKNRHLTPSKAAAGVPLKRTASGDSLGGTPKGLGSTLAVNRTMPSLSNPLSEEWQRIGRDMNESARDLKRAAQDLLRHEDAVSCKRGVLMTMEALLYYTLVYCTRDQSSRAQDRPIEVKRWLTILPLWRWCNNNVKAFPQLQGLCQQVGLVIRVHIAANAGKRAHLGNTASGEDDELRSFLVENITVLSELARESSKNLPVQTLVNQYPKTWTGQSDPSELSSPVERLVPEKYNGPYFLPLGLHTSPIHAVRMGRAFLEEWVEQEGIDYTFKLNL